MRSMVWFRGRDLRVEDQAALESARGELIPVVVLEPQPASAPFRQAFERQAMATLDAALRALGSRLVVLRGEAETVIPAWAQAWRVDQVATLARVEPHWRGRDQRLQAALAGIGCDYRLHGGDTLAPPGSVRTGAGTAYSVFTPFARAFRQLVSGTDPLPAPGSLPPLPPEVEAAGPGWTGPEPGRESAGTRLAAFLEQRLEGYGQGRNRLGEAGISRLSADLRAGTLSIRTLWQGVADRLGQGFDPDAQAYLNELLWREFAHHTLWERPELAAQPFRAAWAGFPWREDPEGFAAWREGRTGIPLVDAAARELLATGFVHNRARMVAACFLTKQLMLDWRLGEAHYRALLVDGCQAANSLGWQWSAGCGVDAQPWFRIFNPELQGRKFDPLGGYVRRWVPELAQVPDRFLHAPTAWGRPLDYPPPIVDHALARQRFLDTAKGHLGGA